MASSSPGRANQKQRTRKALLEAAAQLVGEGGRPSLDEIAEAALVSRATAYRYFPNVDALLLEAAVHMAAPDLRVFEAASATDPIDRVLKVDAAFEDLITGNEAQVRLMLAKMLESTVGADLPSDLPARQNRRSPLIEAALEPSRESLEPGAFRRLVQVLSILIGPESFIVTSDVLRVSQAEAREARRWAIATLVAAAARR